MTWRLPRTTPTALDSYYKASHGHHAIFEELGMAAFRMAMRSWVFRWLISSSTSRSSGP